MEHISQKRGSQPLIQESAAQLGQLDRAVVAPSDRAAETGAVSATQTPQPETSSWEIISKIGDSQAMRTPPLATPTPLLSRNQSRKVVPWMTTHSRTAQSETSLSRSVTRSCSVTSAGPRQWPFPVRHSLGGEPGGSRLWPPVLGRPLPISLQCCWLRC